MLITISVQTSVFQSTNCSHGNSKISTTDSELSNLLHRTTTLLIHVRNTYLSITCIPFYKAIAILIWSCPHQFEGIPCKKRHKSPEIDRYSNCTSNMAPPKNHFLWKLTAGQKQSFYAYFPRHHGTNSIWQTEVQQCSNFQREEHSFLLVLYDFSELESIQK